MEDEERQNVLNPWKEKIGGLECKARRRTLDKVYTSLQDRDDDDDEYEHASRFQFDPGSWGPFPDLRVWSQARWTFPLDDFMLLQSQNMMTFGNLWE